jgi:predicted RNase H-like HicB family nuclease
MTKAIDEYLDLPYTVEVIRNEDGFFARVKELPRCMTWTDRIEELWPMVEDAKRAWIEDALEYGDPVPEPEETDGRVGRVLIHIPGDLKRDVERRAAAEGVSVEQFVTKTLAHAVGE